MTTEEKNLFLKDWEKELENKSFEDLATILANKDDYAPEFVEMVQQRIRAHGDYSEEKANAIIETAIEERKQNEELAEQRMSGWLMFFMFGLVFGSLSLLFRTYSIATPEYYGYNLPLMWTEITITLGVVVLAGYAFIALYKKWNNAVYLVYTYLGVAVFLNLLSWIQLGSEANIRVLFGGAVAIIWCLYFSNSERIKARYPEEERSFFKRDKYIIGTIIVIPIVLFIWGLNSTPSSPSLSIADGLEAGEIDQTSLIIDEKKLGENEVTDGFTIVTIPQGIKHEIVDIEEGHKMLVLTDEKGNAFYEIRIISGFAESFSSSDFEEYWLQSRDSTMLDDSHELTTNTTSEIKAGKCYRKVEEYQSELTVIWDFSMVFSYKTHKYCLLSAWYNKKDDVPIDDIIDSIKFEQ